MCQKVNGIKIGYALGFQEHALDIPGPLRWHDESLTSQQLL